MLLSISSAHTAAIVSNVCSASVVIHTTTSWQCIQQLATANPFHTRFPIYLLPLLLAMSLLASWLSAAGLASLHPVFVSYGVTDASFVELQFQDYDAMGIFEPPERQRLFKLIQQVKRQQQAQAQPSAAAAAQQSNSTQQQQPQPNQQPTAPLPHTPQPQSQQPLSTIQQQQPPSQPQFSAPPQPPKPTQVPRASMAALQSAPQTTRRIDQLSQPRDRAIVERAASISVSSAAAPSFIASATPPPSHSPPLASPRASMSSKRRSGVNQFDLQPVNNPPPQPHLPHHEEHAARVSRLQDDDDTSLAEADDEDYDDDNDINSSMAAIDLSTASALNNSNQTDDPYNSKIRVAVRKRPINSKEKSQGQLDVATVNGNRAVTIHEPKVKVDLTKYVESHKFCFDEVFDENGTNEDIYATTCKPLIPFFLNKGKATCFAYGQTGSGK